MDHFGTIYIDAITNTCIYIVIGIWFITLLNSGCTCSDFVNKNGYGNCRKDYKDGPICYVNLPSQCKDLVDSSKDPSKQYSWEACKNVGFGKFQDPAK